MKTVLDLIGHTPLVALQSIGRGLPVPILAKCEQFNPGGSVKDRLALALTDGMAPGTTLIEATAGNTGIGLCLIASVRHYKVVCVMPEKMSADKRTTLQQLGARVIVTPNAPPDHPDNFQSVARRLAAENGWHLTDQFRHPANARVHAETTAPEIWEQTGGQLGAFVAGAGTGGTITGVGRFLKARAPAVRVVLADPIGSGLAGWVETGTPGADGSYQVEGIGSSRPPEVLDRAVIDGAERISDEESFAMTWRLIREEGLYVGGSSGTAVAAALRVARVASGPVVVLLPDAWDRYRSQPWMR